MGDEVTDLDEEKLFAAAQRLRETEAKMNAAQAAFYETQKEHAEAHEALLSEARGRKMGGRIGDMAMMDRGLAGQRINTLS